MMFYLTDSSETMKWISGLYKEYETEYIKNQIQSTNET